MGVEHAETPDEELWRRARDRDGSAFGELFERHASAVYNHCFRRTASWSTAEDLTSVVFLEAWRRRKDVRLCGASTLGLSTNVVNVPSSSVPRGVVVAVSPGAGASVSARSTVTIENSLGPGPRTG